MEMFTMIKLIILPIKLIKLFTILSIEVVKFTLKLPFLASGVIKKWTKAWRLRIVFDYPFCRAVIYSYYV